MKRKRFLHLATVLIAAIGMFILGACGEAGTDDSVETSTQQLTGSLPDQSGAELPDVVAVDQRGIQYLFETDENGDFRLALPTGHTYELYINENGTRGLEQASQLVFPRADDQVDTTVTIGGAMAPFDLGEVRPAGTLETAQYHITQASGEENGDVDQRPDSAGQPDDLPTEGADSEEADSEEADSEEADSEEADSEEADAEDAMDCPEGPPGLYCVHDGAHPACQGLAIAAANRAAARGNASEAQQTGEEGRRIAEEARQRAEQDAEEADADDEEAEADSEEEEADAEDDEDQASAESDGDNGPGPNDRPIALPQFNPPFEFPGCSFPE